MGHHNKIGKTLAVFIAGIGLSSIAAGVAHAQKEPSELCPSGQVVVLRVSKILEGGSRAGFERGVVDQTAWYRGHGFTANRLISADVLTQDPATKTWSRSDSEVLSLHINPPPISAIKPDAAWSAFVTEFKHNAVVEAERTACLDQPLG
jgi:hypothetical protein